MLRLVKNTIFHYIRLWFGLFSDDCKATLSEGPVLIIAPHPDDETIGCGASTARFCAEGRKVRVIIVTNGNASTQSAIITPGELAELRRNESLKAAKILGLSEEDVIFLAYPDGQVAHHIKDISQVIADHIQQFAPAIIFTPHPFDEHEDHRSVASIVGQLQNAGAFNARVFQYPVWYNTLSWPYGILRSLVSLSMYNRCRQWPISDFLAKKEKALMQYRSQFENLTGEDCWRFFSEASRKRFCDSLELFFERFAEKQNQSTNEV